jgi:hypothetical protein
MRRRFVMRTPVGERAGPMGGWEMGWVTGSYQADTALLFCVCSALPFPRELLLSRYACTTPCAARVSVCVL